MNWLAVILLLFCLLYTVYGARRGLVRMVVSMVFMILVMVLSSVLNPRISSFLKESTPLYDSLTEYCSDMVETKMEAMEGDMTLNLQVQLIDELPVPKNVRDALLKNNNEKGYKSVAAADFADYVGAYLGNLLLRAASFLLSYIASFILVGIFLRVTDLMTKLPLVSQVNYLGGGLIGFFMAMIWISVLFLLASLFSSTQFGHYVQQAVEGSAYVRWFYDHNLMWILLEILLG